MKKFQCQAPLVICLAIAIFAGYSPLLPIEPATAESPAAQTKPLGIAATKPATGPSVEIDGGFMVPYTDKIPGTDLTFEMIPIPGGTFLMGSPEDEADRGDDEGPQFKVIVDPMWVAKTEVTWAQYQQYMSLYKAFKEFEASGIRSVNDENRIDAVTAPTELYEPTFTFEYGQDPDQAAVTMTQYSAQQFTKWLSRTTGSQYRLPTEAEWEYAARAGSQTAYHWGDDPALADQYAWYFDNSDEGQALIGKLKANAFGLHDMLGNVYEWTVNKHTDDYSEFKAKEPINATEVVKWPTELGTGCVLRGGSWEVDSDQLRCAARLVSEDEDWKDADPNFPLSPWWFTNDPARGVGFRLFRSAKPLDKATITKFWEANAEDVKDDVQARVDEGRGGYGLVDKDLPTALKSLKQ